MAAVADRTALTVLSAAALVLAACSPAADTTAPPAPDAPTAEESSATAGRTFVVDWPRAAQSSAEGVEQPVAALRITVPLPAGWYSMLGWALLKHGAVPPNGAGIVFERPLALYADRCTWADPDGLLPIGPTVDDLVDALVEHPQYAATNVRDITVDGFAGKEFDMLGAPDDLDLTQCSPGTRPDGSRAPHLHRPWAGTYLMGPTEVNRVRVLDVGGERVVIRALHFAGTSEDDLTELFHILDTIEIATDE